VRGALRQLLAEPSTRLATGSFEIYLIMVGIRSFEYTYSDEDIFNHIDYFRDCYNRNLSAYKALLFLYDHIGVQSGY